MPNTIKYKTDEERREARLAQKREWARKNRKVFTYRERISKMTPEEYRVFLDKHNEYNKKKYHENKE